MGNLRDFPWPCDRREAHGGHWTLFAPDTREGLETWCPGVRAHPLTMAGGSWRE